MGGRRDVSNQESEIRGQRTRTESGECPTERHIRQKFNSHEYTLHVVVGGGGQTMQINKQMGGQTNKSFPLISCLTVPHKHHNLDKIPSM